MRKTAEIVQKIHIILKPTTSNLRTCVLSYTSALERQGDGNFSTNHKMINKWKIQSCLVIGWNSCRRSKYLLRWLSGTLSYILTKKMQVLKLEVRDPYFYTIFSTFFQEKGKTRTWLMPGERWKKNKVWTLMSSLTNLTLTDGITVTLH
jgi:hypothetical protein